MQYTIVEVHVTKGTRNLIDAVREKMQKGWKPQGGVSSDTHYIRQAMVRKGKI